jgi:hypothetical protein
MPDLEERGYIGKEKSDLRRFLKFFTTELILIVIILLSNYNKYRVLK